MDKINILITLRLIMKSSSVMSSLIFDLIVSFSAGEVSMYSSSFLFLYSSPRFLAQPSVSLGESLDSRVLSLVSPIYYSLLLNGEGVFLLCFYSSVILSSFDLLLGFSGP